jgi:hypothetical protein
MILILLKYYVVLLATSLTIVTGGLLMVKYLREMQATNGYLTLLLALLAGTTTLVTAYALVVTEGSTIMGLFLLLSAFYGLSKLRKPAHANLTGQGGRLPSWWWAEALVILTLAFLWQANSMVSFGYEYFITPNADLVFAARNIHLLNELGIERTIYTDGPVEGIAGNTPYHYYEYWFIAALSKISGNLPIFTLKLNQVPFFLLGTYWGLCGLVKHYMRTSILFVGACSSPTFLFMRLIGQLLFIRSRYLSQPTWQCKNQCCSKPCPSIFSPLRRYCLACVANGMEQY